MQVEGLFIAEALDPYELLSVEMENGDADVAHRWIDKDDAQKIVDHLTRVFELKDQ